MSAKGSWPSYNVRSFLELIHRYRASSGNVSHSRGSGSTVSKIGRGLSMHQGLQLIVANSNKWRRSHFNMLLSFLKFIVLSSFKFFIYFNSLILFI
jgi:hypothetical protein